MAGPILHCVQCGRELTGRQLKFCSNKCKQADKGKRKRIGVSETTAAIQMQPATHVSSIGEAASTGDQYAALVALRQKLAYELDVAATARDIGTLSARLLDTLERIAAVEAKRDTSKAGGALDELTRRREARREAVS